jgi:uncharacterized protein with HEPN domain
MQHALIMGLLNIGELAAHLDEDAKTELPDVPWVQIIGLRNAAAHGYAKLSLDSIWRTSTEDVPDLKAKLATSSEISTQDK